jgi:uncharacterized protein YjbJ (UPF0337 family)
MNVDMIAGRWDEIRGDVRSRWARITDDDLARADGDFDYLVDLVQARYGMIREVAERQVRDFGRRLEH